MFSTMAISALVRPYKAYTNWPIWRPVVQSGVVGLLRLLPHISGAQIILMSVQVETNYPRPSRDVTHGFCVCGKARQSGFQLPGNASQVREHPVREFFFSQF